jgi:hypothetical protein
MAATRVRVLFEYRNGNTNYLSTDKGHFVEAKGEFDLSALDAAYLSALQAHGIKQEAIKELVQRVNRSD